jgi:hypothetical protein
MFLCGGLGSGRGRKLNERNERVKRVGEAEPLRPAVKLPSNRPQAAEEVGLKSVEVRSLETGARGGPTAKAGFFVALTAGLKACSTLVTRRSSIVLKRFERLLHPVLKHTLWGRPVLSVCRRSNTVSARNRSLKLMLQVMAAFG